MMCVRKWLRRLRGSLIGLLRCRSGGCVGEKTKRLEFDKLKAMKAQGRKFKRRFYEADCPKS